MKRLLLSPKQQVPKSASPPRTKATSPRNATSPKEKKVDKDGFTTGNWTAEEDERLKGLVAMHGSKTWSALEVEMKTRTGKQMRERWTGHLDGARITGPWSPEEDAKLDECQSQPILRNKWAQMAKIIHGRTDNDIKNHWNLRKNKKGSEKNLASLALAPAHDIMVVPRSATMSTSSSSQSVAFPPSPMVKSSSSHSLSSVGSSMPASKSSTSLASIASPRYAPYPSSRSTPMVKSRSEQVGSPRPLVSSTSAIPLGQQLSEGYSSSNVHTSPGMARSQSYSVPGAYSPRTPRSLRQDEALYPSPGFSRNLSNHFEMMDAPLEIPAAHSTPTRPAMQRLSMSTPLLPTSTLLLSHFSPMTPLSLSREPGSDSPLWGDLQGPFSPENPIPPFSDLDINDKWIDSTFLDGRSRSVASLTYPSAQLSYDQPPLPFHDAPIKYSASSPSLLLPLPSDPYHLGASIPFGYDDPLAEFLEIPHLPHPTNHRDPLLPSRAHSPGFHHQKWTEPHPHVGAQNSSVASSSSSARPSPVTEERTVEITMLDEEIAALANSTTPTTAPLTPISTHRVVAPKVRSSSRTIRSTTHISPSSGSGGPSEMNYTPSPTTRLTSASYYSHPSTSPSSSSSRFPRQMPPPPSSAYPLLLPPSSPDSAVFSPSVHTMTRSPFAPDLNTYTHPPIVHANQYVAASPTPSRGRGTNGWPAPAPAHGIGIGIGVGRGAPAMSGYGPAPFVHPTGDLMEIDSFGKAMFPGGLHRTSSSSSSSAAYS